MLQEGGWITDGGKSASTNSRRRNGGRDLYIRVVRRRWVREAVAMAMRLRTCDRSTGERGTGLEPCLRLKRGWDGK
jgi:hypothetical protein